MQIADALAVAVACGLWPLAAGLRPQAMSLEAMSTDSTASAMQGLEQIGGDLAESVVRVSYAATAA